MQLFTFDDTVKFFRGKKLTDISFTGTSCKIGAYKGLTCYAYILTGYGKNEKELSAKSLNVEAFICSKKFTQPDIWETYIIGAPKGMTWSIPLSCDNKPMLSSEELKNYIL